MDDEKLMQEIKLREGAPPLSELFIQLVVREQISFDPQNYKAQGDSSILPHIGKEVETILEAANEERLMLLRGDTGIYDMLGFDDAEMGVAGSGWEILLVDKDGTVWSVLEDKGVPQ